MGREGEIREMEIEISFFFFLESCCRLGRLAVFVGLSRILLVDSVSLLILSFSYSLSSESYSSLSLFFFFLFPPLYSLLFITLSKIQNFYLRCFRLLSWFFLIPFPLTLPPPNPSSLPISLPPLLPNPPLPPPSPSPSPSSGTVTYGPSNPQLLALLSWYGTGEPGANEGQRAVSRTKGCSIGHHWIGVLGGLGGSFRGGLGGPGVMLGGSKKREVE